MGTGFRKRSRTNEKLERDDDSTNNHPTLVAGDLSVTDPELAAEHFFGMLAGHRQYRALLGVAEPGRPSDGTRAAETVRAFLRAYRV